MESNIILAGLAVVRSILSFKVLLHFPLVMIAEIDISLFYSLESDSLHDDKRVGIIQDLCEEDDGKTTAPSNGTSQLHIIVPHNYIY